MLFNYKHLGSIVSQSMMCERGIKNLMCGPTTKKLFTSEGLIKYIVSGNGLYGVET